MTTIPTVLALVPDLFFSSRLRSAADALGLRVVTERRADRLVAAAEQAGAALVIVDMGIVGQDWAAGIQALRAAPTTRALPIIAFGPHVDADSQASARAAGASRVLANSRFVETLPALLRQYAAPAGPAEVVS